MLIRRVARPMLAATFIGQGIESLRNPRYAGEAARPTVEGLQKLPDAVSSNVPSDPELFAKLTAAAQIGGGLLLASGRVPRLAAAVLAATVIPANLGAHMFWNETDPVRKSRQRRDFLVDVSLLGGLVIASADTAGRPSLGWRGRRAAEALSGSVAGVIDTAEAATPVIDAAGMKGRKAAKKARKAGAEIADTAARRAAAVTSVVRDKAEDVAGATRSFTKDQGAPVLEDAKKGARQLLHR